MAGWKGFLADSAVRFVKQPPSDEWDPHERRHPAGQRAMLPAPLLLAADTLLLRMARPSRWLTSSVVVLLVCACLATVLVCSSSEGNSNIRTCTSTAPATLLRAHRCNTLLSASPAASRAALSCTCSLQFHCSYSQTRVRLFYPLVDPLRLEPAQQRPPWRTHLRHACVLCRTLSPAALPLRFFSFPTCPDGSAPSFETVLRRFAHLLCTFPPSRLDLRGLPPLPWCA